MLVVSWTRPLVYQRPTRAQVLVLRILWIPCFLPLTFDKQQHQQQSKVKGRSKWVGGVLSHSTLVKSRSGTASQFPFFLIFWCLGFVVGLGRTQKGSVLCLESWLIAVLKLISLMKPYLCTGLVYTWDYDPYGIHCTVSKWWATSTLDVGGIQLLCYLWGGLKWAAWF